MNNLDIPAWAVDSDSESDDGKDKDVPSTKDIEMQQNNQEMELFYRAIDILNANIKVISQATKEIGVINDKSLHATTSAEEKNLSEQLTPLINSTNRKAKETKSLLGTLREETDEMKKTKKLSDSHLRSRETMNNTLTRKFVDEMKSYQQAQEKYKRGINDKVRRQVKSVKADATDEEIEEVLKSEGGRDALIKKTILAGGVNDQVKNTYDKVAGKYQDVLTLEQSIVELHQMFMDFALLTEQQGEQLDQIAYNVSQASDYIEAGNEQIHEAKTHQAAARKKQCMIILIVALCGSVVVYFILK